MFNSPILDLAITLSFTYFILGIIVSTVHEFIYSVLFSKRGKFLKRAIENLFFDEDWKKLSTKIFQNEHIQALKKRVDSNPSYIPAKNFSLALIEQFRNHDSVIDMNYIREVLTNKTKAQITGIDGSVRKVLLGLFERAQGDLQTFQQQIENFYDDAMNRAADIYVRSTKKALLMISLIIAGALNVDTFNIAEKLWSDPNTLKHTADNIGNTINEFNATYGTNVNYGDIKIHGDSLIIESKDSSSSINTIDSIPIGHTVKDVKSTIVYIKKAGIPLGWSKENYPKDCLCKDFWSWVFKIFGILLTAIALSLGAPFWFDLLNKFVNLRGNSKKNEDSQKDNKSNSSAEIKPVG